MSRKECQGFAYGLLSDKLPRGRLFSPGAIRDIIAFGGTFQYENRVGRPLYDLIMTHCVDQEGFEADFLRKLRAVLVEYSLGAAGPRYHAVTLRHHTATLFRELRQIVFPDRYDYPELRHITIHITSNINEMIHIMRGQLTRRSSWPLYIDTEGTYTKLPNRTKLSLITIFDVSPKMVYLFRTFQLSKGQLQVIKRELNVVEEYRQPVTFGPEKELGCNTRDIQRGSNQSLRDMVHQASQKVISKTETLSDWTTPTLRHDQVQYAAMDAIALHYINTKTTFDWSRDLPRPVDPESRPLFFSASEPTVTQITQLETIRDDLLEIIDGMDWLLEYVIFGNLEDIRTKLESVMRWERYWEWPKHWELVVRNQIHALEDNQLLATGGLNAMLGESIQNLKNVLQ